jgi:hypothetical protein
VIVITFLCLSNIELQLNETELAPSVISTVLQVNGPSKNKYFLMENYSRRQLVLFVFI